MASIGAQLLVAPRQSDGGSTQYQTTFNRCWRGIDDDDAPAQTLALCQPKPG